MRRSVWVAVITAVAVMGLAIPSVAETVITKTGSVLQGQIEFGIPGLVSITSSTGDIFTVQRTNLKAIRFPSDEGGDTVVETFDGNILVGILGGIPEVIGLRTPAGDVQSIKLASIQEIRFEAAPAAPSPTPVPSPPTVVTPSVSGTPEAIASQIRDSYAEREQRFALALDTGFQLGLVTRNGFAIPTSAIGVNLLGLGAVWRVYFPPSAQSIEKAALAVAKAAPTITLDNAMTAVREEKTPGSNFYLYLGTNTVIIPEAGVGWQFRLGPTAYFDVGVGVDFLLSLQIVLGLIWVL
jgi:hypothetical protein